MEVDGVAMDDLVIHGLTIKSCKARKLELDDHYKKAFPAGENVGKSHRPVGRYEVP